MYLSKAKIHQHSSLPVDVEQKVSRNVNGAPIGPTDCLRWLYVSVYNATFVHSGKSLE